MLIICDYRSPAIAVKKLTQQGNVVLFNSRLLTPMPLHGHPDLYLCQTPNTLILAPNVDLEILAKIKEEKVPFVFGKNPVIPQHPEIARYNAVVTNKVTICNPKTVDPKILETSLENLVIDVKQSYNRCSTVTLSDDFFLTSDSKTHLQLIHKGFESILINPKTIKIEGYSHGLFGGCAGVCKTSNTLYVMGSLNSLSNSEEIKTLVAKSNLSLCELSNENLLDVGGLFFL